MKIDNPTQGVYTNAIESINAKYKRMQEEGTHSMPEAVYTCYTLQRGTWREITKAYHQTGNFNLREDCKHLARDPTQMPHFGDKSEEEYLQTLKGSIGYRDIEDIASETRMDPAQVEVDEIKRQHEWYKAKGEEVVKYDYDLVSWKVAAYQENIQEKAFLTTVNSCTCERKVPCVHWYTVNKMMRINISDAMIHKGCTDRLKQEKVKKATKRKLDLGRKGPTLEGDKAMATKVRKTKEITTVDASMILPKKTRKNPAAPTQLNIEKNAELEVHATQDLPVLGDADLRTLKEFMRSVPKTTPMDVDDPPPVARSDTNFSLPTLPTLSPPDEDLYKAIVHDEEDQHGATGPQSATSEGDAPLAIDIDTYSPSMLAKHCQLNPLEGRYIVKENKDIAFIKVDKRMKAAVVYPDTATPEIQKELQFIAAKMIQQGQVYNKQTRKRFVDLQMKPFTEDQFPAKAFTHCNNMTFIMKGKVTPTPIECVCNHPDVDGIKQNFDLTCTQGKEKFHSDCFKTKPKDDNFLCAPCSLSSVHKGCVWAEKSEKSEYVKNTCPIDGGLTAVVIHKKSQNPAITDSFPDDPAHNALKEAINHLEQNDSHKAQKALLDYYKSQKDPIVNLPAYKKYQEKKAKIMKENEKIKADNKKKGTKVPKKLKDIPPTRVDCPYENVNLDKNNLMGEHRALWADTLKEGNTFTLEYNCQKCKKSNTNTSSAIPMFHIRRDDTVALFMSKQTYAGYDTTCHKAGCGGKVEISPIQPHGHPWMLSWDCQSIPEDQKKQVAKDIFSGDLPKQLEIAGRTYQLSHITYNIPRTHFVSVHYDHNSGSWAYYDGQSDSVKDNSRKNFNNTSSPSYDNVTVTYVQYPISTYISYISLTYYNNTNLIFI